MTYLSATDDVPEADTAFDGEDPFAGFDDSPVTDGTWDLDLDLSFDDLGFDQGFDVAYDSATTSFDTTATSSESAVSWDSGFDF